MHKLHGVIKLGNDSSFDGTVRKRIQKLDNVEYVFGSAIRSTQMPRVKTIESVNVHGELIVIERLASYVCKLNSLIPYKIRQRTSDGIYSSIVFPNNICRIMNSINSIYPLIEDIRTHIISAQPEYKDILDYLFNYGDSGYDCTLFSEDIISESRLENHISQFINELNSMTSSCIVPDIGLLLRSPFVVEDTVSLRSMCGTDLRIILSNTMCENSIDLSRPQDALFYDTPCMRLDSTHREILQLLDGIIITDFDIVYICTGIRKISYCIDRFQMFYGVSFRGSYSEDMFILDNVCRVITTTLL